MEAKIVQWRKCESLTAENDVNNVAFMAMSNGSM